MLWIRVDIDLNRNRKLRELAIQLDTPKTIAKGMLVELWSSALASQEDGDLTKWSDDAIADCCHLNELHGHMKLQGGPPAFVKLLQEIGWLDGRLIHDWPDFAGPFLMSRYASDQREKLVDIWRKHGRTYGERRGAPPRAESPPAPRRAPARAAAAPDPIAVNLATELAAALRANDPKARVPAALETWAAEANLLLTSDGRDYAEVRRVLAWCQTDDFWKANILSMAKFREKYPTLRLQMGSAGPGPASPGPKRPETCNSCKQRPPKRGEMYCEPCLTEISYSQSQPLPRRCIYSDGGSRCLASAVTGKKFCAGHQRRIEKRPDGVGLRPAAEAIKLKED